MPNSSDVSPGGAWLQRVMLSQNEEILCSECLDQVARYVDLELGGSDAAHEMPEVKHHLDQCRVCREEYEILLALARLEAQGLLPDAASLRAQFGGDGTLINADER